MVIRAGCKKRIPHYNIEIHMIEIAHVKIQGVLCLRGFLRLWKNNSVSRKLCKQRSDLVLNGQMRVPK